MNMVKLDNKLRKLQFWYPNIPRRLVMAKGISIQAKFVYIYMSCQSEHFEFFHEPMAREMDIAPRTLVKYIEELVQSGWITKGEQMFKNGRKGAVEYTVETSPKKKQKENTDVPKTASSNYATKDNSSINTPINNDNEGKRLSNDNQKVEYSDDFIEFWKAYGYSIDKQETYKRWKKLSKKDKEDALKAITDYFSDCVNHNRQKRYPAVYISKRTWENDYGKNNTVEEIPEERLDGWERSQEWMRKFIPRIAGRITFTDFDTMRGTVYHNREVFSDILQEINNSDYEGDIVNEFCRLSQTEEYNKRIFGI